MTCHSCENTNIQGYRNLPLHIHYLNSTDPLIDQMSQTQQLYSDLKILNLCFGQDPNNLYLKFFIQYTCSTVH